MKKKPRIIILMHYMELGGAEMALLGLLGALDPERVDVDLFIYSHQGPLMKFIPEWINLLPEVTAYSVIERPITEAIKKRQFGVATGRLIAKFKHRHYVKKSNITGDDASLFSFIGKVLCNFLPTISADTEYDLCLSFLIPHNFGLNKVRAKKRVAWIHTDYTRMYVNTDLELDVWNAYDAIASISDDVTQSFLKVFPSLESKIIKIENILPESYVLSKADESDVSGELTGSVKLLSIGRFCTAKNYDNVPDIAQRIKESGIRDFRWYIIGFGGSEDLIRSKIKESGMENHVIILGKKDNPYPYIKACDIYVQPSRYEGKSITVREAQILGKPVVVTAYPTAKSQINNGVDGVIVPLDNEGCALGLAEIIKNTEMQKTLSEYCQTHDFSSKSEVSQIYKFLN